jgi:hypothetical protein
MTIVASLLIQPSMRFLDLLKMKANLNALAYKRGNSDKDASLASQMMKANLKTITF